MSVILFPCWHPKLNCQGVGNTDLFQKLKKLGVPGLLSPLGIWFLLRSWSCSSAWSLLVPVPLLLYLSFIHSFIHKYIHTYILWKTIKAEKNQIVLSLCRLRLCATFVFSLVLLFSFPLYIIPYSISLLSQIFYQVLFLLGDSFLCGPPGCAFTAASPGSRNPGAQLVLGCSLWVWSPVSHLSVDKIRASKPTRQLSFLVSPGFVTLYVPELLKGVILNILTSRCLVCITSSLYLKNGI